MWVGEARRGPWGWRKVWWRVLEWNKENANLQDEGFPEPQRHSESVWTGIWEEPEEPEEPDGSKKPNESDGSNESDSFFNWFGRRRLSNSNSFRLDWWKWGTVLSLSSRTARISNKSTLLCISPKRGEGEKGTEGTSTLQQRSMCYLQITCGLFYNFLTAGCEYAPPNQSSNSTPLTTQICILHSELTI